MDKEAKNLLERNLRVSEENNKLLKKIRHSMIIRNLMTIVYWAIIIGIPIILYYYVLEPYFNQVSNTYTGIKDSFGQIGEQVPVLKNLLNNLP